MDHFTEDDFLESSGNLRDALLPYTVCILMGPDPHGDVTKWRWQGTGTLVAMKGRPPFLMTARHVYSQLCELRLQSESACMALSGSEHGLTVLEAVEPLGCRADVDAIALTLGPSFSPASVQRRFLPVCEWPPRITDGERCVFIGVPIEHTVEWQGGLDLYWAAMDLRATSVDEIEVTLGPDPDGQRIVVDSGAGLGAPYDWQGVSGAGLYALRGAELQLAGVVFGGSGDYGRDTSFRAYHADLVPLG